MNFGFSVKDDLTAAMISFLGISERHHYGHFVSSAFQTIGDEAWAAEIRYKSPGLIRYRRL